MDFAAHPGRLLGCLTFRFALRGSKRSFVVRLLPALVAAWLAGANVSFSQPALPVPVLDEELDDAPYRFVGSLLTSPVGQDPTLLGSGWVAGKRVVVSAAHVFFLDEYVRWNGNKWYWRRAPTEEEFWNLADIREPRAFRALVGYSGAVQREIRAGGDIVDSLNRDTITLLFYRDVIDGDAAPRAVDQLNGSGRFLVAGYPMSIAGGVVDPLGNMFAHKGGVAASYVSLVPGIDPQGFSYALSISEDLLSGPGASGGPVMREIGGKWTVVGVHVAALVDNSATIERRLDAEADALIQHAIDDSGDLVVGTLAWSKDEARITAPPVRRDDGSVVVAANVGNPGTDNFVIAFSSDGDEVWRRWLPARIDWLAEAPDGRIIANTFSSGLYALMGGSGEVLWKGSIPWMGFYFAVSETGDVIGGGYGSLYSISPEGERSLIIKLTEAIVDADSFVPAIGPDGTVLVEHEGRIVAINPNTKSVRWKSDPLTGIVQTSLAATVDGGALVLANGSLVRFAPDGSVAWTTFVRQAESREPMLKGDGSILMPANWEPHGIYAYNAGGVALPRMDLSFDPGIGSYTITADAAGNVYFGSDAGLEVFSPGGGQLWRDFSIRGRVVLGGSRLWSFGIYAGKFTSLGTAAPRHPADWEPVVGGTDNARRVFNSLPVAPRIVVAPQGKKVPNGYRFELEVVAAGSFPMTFQWRRNGAVIPDEIGRRLIVTEANTGDVGSYTVTVRNAAGEITSAAVPISVFTPAFGDRLWTTALVPQSPPAIAQDGTVYAVVGVEPPAGPGNFGYYLAAITRSGNELWRFDLGIETSAGIDLSFSPPVIMDNGQVLLGHAQHIWVVNGDGNLAWSESFAEGYRAPSLALTYGERFLLIRDGLLRCYDYHGGVVWQRVDPNFVGSLRLLVRRDGAVAVQMAGEMRLIGPAGDTLPLDPLIAGPVYDLGIIGPRDELIVVDSSLGVATVDFNGAIVSETPDARVNRLDVMLSDGLMLSDYLPYAAPYWGKSRRELVPPGDYGLVVAATNGHRFVTVGAGKLYLLESDGTVADEAEGLTGENWILGPDGELVGGGLLSSTFVGLPPASSPWAQVRADSRNSSRAPLAFDPLPGMVESVQIVSSSEAFEGYALKLDAVVEASGYYTLQWRRNGVVIAGQVSNSMRIPSATTANSGTYTVVATGDNGSVTSSAYAVSVGPPYPAPPGTYGGACASTAVAPRVPFVMTVYVDRTFDFLYGGSAFQSVSGALGPRGEFTVNIGSNGLSGAFVSGSVHGDGSAVVSASAGAISGVAANGLPAGVYRGRATGQNAWPAVAIVLADGTFSWAQEKSGGELNYSVGQFAGGSLTTTVNALIDGGSTVAFAVKANASGAIIAHTDSSDLDFDGFGVTKDGRASVERLVNLSTRGYVSPDMPPMIAGFVVSGNAPHSLLLRGVGPRLGPLGVQGPLADPRIRLINFAGNELDRNEGWNTGGTADVLRAAAQRLYAFSFAEGSADAAMFETVPAGNFTMTVESIGGRSGVALVEAYEDVSSLPAGATTRLRNLSTRGTVGSGERVLIGGLFVSGEAAKTFLIRAVGPGLDRLVNGAFPLTSNPRLRVTKVKASSHFAENDDWWNSPLAAEVESISNQIGAFKLPAGSRDAAILLHLPPGGYTILVDNVNSDVGVALLEVYEVPVP